MPAMSPRQRCSCLSQGSRVTLPYRCTGRAPLVFAGPPSVAGKRSLGAAHPGQTQTLHEYLVAHAVQANTALDGLQQASLQHAKSRMLSPPDSITILQLLLKLTNASVVVEVGTFTGYTALGLAQGLPPDGIVYTLDISDADLSIGKPWWQLSGISNKIKFIQGPASQSLQDLTEVLGPGSIDLGFIDADKDNYDTYFEQLMVLVRPGGVIVIDNVLWGGAVLDPNDTSSATQAIKNLNAKLYRDKRVQIAMLKNSDGMTIAVRL